MLDEAAIQAAQERLGDADNLWVLDADEVAAWHAALTDAAIEPDLRV